MDVHAVLVGGGRRSSARAERAQAEAARELELARQVHAQNEKLNRLNGERGVPGRWTCTSRCPVCHPADDVAASTGLDILDLRGSGARPRKVLRGKRGRCHGATPDGKACGARIARRGWYCRDCKDRRARRR